jgi:hypothetical protein
MVALGVVCGLPRSLLCRYMYSTCRVQPGGWHQDTTAPSLAILPCQTDQAACGRGHLTVIYLWHLLCIHYAIAENTFRLGGGAKIAAEPSTSVLAGVERAFCLDQPSLQHYLPWAWSSLLPCRPRIDDNASGSVEAVAEAAKAHVGTYCSMHTVSEADSTRASGGERPSASVGGAAGA